MEQREKTHDQEIAEEGKRDLRAVGKFFIIANIAWQVVVFGWYALSAYENRPQGVHLTSAKFVLSHLYEIWIVQGKPKSVFLGYETGGDFHPFAMTNTMSIQGCQQTCLIGLELKAFKGTGSAAVTTDGALLWIPKDGGKPKIVGQVEH